MLFLSNRYCYYEYKLENRIYKPKVELVDDINFLPSDLGLNDFVDFFDVNAIWIDSNYNIDGLVISRNYYLVLSLSETWIVSANTFSSTNAATSNNFLFLFSNTYFFNIFFLTTSENKFYFIIDFLHLTSLLLPLLGVISALFYKSIK